MQTRVYNKINKVVWLISENHQPGQCKELVSCVECACPRYNHSIARLRGLSNQILVCRFWSLPNTSVYCYSSCSACLCSLGMFTCCYSSAHGAFGICIQQRSQFCLVFHTAAGQHNENHSMVNLVNILLSGTR